MRVIAIAVVLSVLGGCIAVKATQERGLAVESQGFKLWNYGAALYLESDGKIYDLFLPDGRQVGTLSRNEVMDLTEIFQAHAREQILASVSGIPAWLQEWLQHQQYGKVKFKALLIHAVRFGVTRGLLIIYAPRAGSSSYALYAFDLPSRSA